MIYVYLVLGLGILIFGADLLIRGASSLARRFGLSELLVGLTVVSFGTSAPELAVSVKAGLANQGGIALGNIVGSNIFNISLILGITALIRPLTVQLKIVRKDMPILLGVTLLFAAILFYQHGIHRVWGLLLFTGLLGYTYLSFKAEKGIQQKTVLASQRGTATVMRPAMSLVLIVVGLGLLVFGARLFVDNASLMARQFGVSEAVIGLTIVSAGTSLPELAASVVAAIRGKADIAVGNVVGSNIFNMLCIGGIASLVTPLAAGGIRSLDIGFMLFTSLLLLPFMKSGFRLSRIEGGLLLGCFVLYLYLTWPR